MATTTARNKTDVENMTARDRLWDSLNYSYGQKRDESNRSFDRAISQQDRAMLGRGMQRSSYNNQTLANMRKQQVDASNAIYDQQIADYENRLGDIENQEWQRDMQERQFAESKRQFDTNLAFNQERAAASDKQWQTQFDEGVRQYNANMEYQRGRDAVTDNQWNQTFQYQQGRDAIGDSQWERQFAEGVRQNNQSTSSNLALSILANGQMPTDELLAAAGISRADAEKLMKQAAASGGSPGPKTTGDTGGDTGDSSGEEVTDQGLEAALWPGNKQDTISDFLLVGAKTAAKAKAKNASTNKTAITTPDKSKKKTFTTATKSGNTNRP